ncbi:MAG: DUF2715 domain-containing protein [Treponema sp.]|nr:DUF2715 domain-containing protein [Treponema sp.]
MKLTKKIFIISSILFAMGTSAFAADTFASANVSFPTNIVNLKSDGINTTDAFHSIGAGVTMKVGLLYAGIDCSFTTQINSKNTDGSKSTVTLQDMKDNDRLVFNLNFLVGAGFSVIENEKMQLVLAPGVHYTYISDKGWMTAKYYTFGIGAEAEFNYFFNETYGITASIQLAYDFFGFSNLDDLAAYSGKKLNWSNFTVIPRIGIVKAM